MELKPLFQDIADAIRAKDGTGNPIKASSFPARIRAIPSGSGPTTSSPKDVNFYDYDGTLAYSYTLAEARALAALPDGPKHDGLVFQSWNWPLEKINTLARPMNVGATYITDDGKTRLKIRILNKSRRNVPLSISQTVAHGTTIDWGDGSALETLDGTGHVDTSHQYANVGEYTISLAAAEGCILSLRSPETYRSLLREVYIGYGVPEIGGYVFRDCYSLMLATLPNGVTSIGDYAFIYCYSLASLTIPEGVTSIGEYVFGYCQTLKNIAIPDGVTSIGGYMFNGCGSLESLTIPEGVTSIGDYMMGSCLILASVAIPESVTNIGFSAFVNDYLLTGVTISEGVTSIGDYAFKACQILASVTIPESVTNIGSGAFESCGGMAEYHIKPAAPPTLSNTNAFSGIPPDCVIYVPAGSLEAYKTATNWSTYADYMREEG